VCLTSILGLVGCGNGSETIDVSQGDPSSIQWMSLEEAELKMKDTPKEIFVMVYADWCPHCKKFDKTTYKDPKVIAEINSNFYPVKINAHSNKDIRYRGQDFSNPDFDPNKSTDERNSYHEILYEIKAGSIPSIVFIGKDFQVKGSELGFKEADELRSLMIMYKSS